MPRVLSEVFHGMAEAIMLRRQSRPYSVDTLKAGIKLLGSAIAESEPNEEDRMILQAAPLAFRESYPSSEPWSGEHLVMLLSQTRNLMHEIVSGRPVGMHRLEEAQYFCTQMRLALLNNANGHA